MKIVKKEPGKGYYAKDIPNTLEAMQAEVGGYIETVTVDRTCCIVCNEEGRIKGLPYNTKLGGIDLFGPVFIVGTKGDEFCDVPDIVEYICVEGQK